MGFGFEVALSWSGILHSLQKKFLRLMEGYYIERVIREKQLFFSKFYDNILSKRLILI